ncbi:MAG: hypothetical protein PHT59_01935 [Candidatus Omnitrophica bacterium]|nr:hypothetical protein [Candidatus Omnitrophota bacterium]
MELPEKTATKFSVLVGGTVFGLEFRGKFPFAALGEVYAPFLTRRRPRYCFQVSAQAADTARGADERFSFVFEKSRYTIRSGIVRAVLDERSQKAEVGFCPEVPAEAMISVLTNLMMVVLSGKGCLFFHACGIADKDRAYVFVGRSGAGKSTVAGFSQHATVLSEELVGIMAARKGPGAFAVPYAGDRRFSRRSNRSYALAGMYSLVKDTKNAVIAVPKPEALAEFYIFPPAVGAGRMLDKHLALYGSLIRSTECFRLHFLPDKTFWRCIHAYGN